MADSATVGTLKVLLQADVSAFNAAMASATADVKKIGDALQKDLEPRQRAINAAVRDFLGTDEIRKAQEYAAALTKIGGTSTLTEENQRKVNKAITDAIAQYKALGQEAPADLLKIQEATKQVDKASSDSLSKLTSGLKSAAALFGVGFGVDAVVQFGKGVFDTASKIHDMSSALGISAEAYQRFTYAAEQSGGSAEAFEKALQRMNDGLAGGEASTVSALKSAGLQFDAIRQMKPEDAFSTIADAIGKIQDPMTRANVAQDLFGKGALQLLPGMIEGYKKLGEAATVMSNDTVDRLEAAQDAWDDLWKKITVVSGEMIASAMNVTKTYTDEQRKLAIDLAIQANQQRGGGDAMDFLAQMLKRVTSYRDINLPSNAASTASVTDYVAELAAARAELDKLTAPMKAQIDAALKLGESQDKIAAALHVSTEALQLYQSETKTSAKAVKDAAKDSADFQTEQWKEQLESQKHYTDESEKDMETFFAKLEDDQKKDAELANDVWQEQLADHKYFVDKSAKEMDEFWKQQKEAALLHAKEFVAPFDVIKSLTDDIGRSMTGVGRFATAAFSSAIDIVKSYKSAMAEAEGETDALKKSQEEAAASTAALNSAFTLGASIVIGWAASNHAKAQQLKQDIADLQTQIEKLGATPLSDTQSAGQKLLQRGDYRDQLQKQLDELTAQQDALNASMGRYNLTLSQTGTPAEQFSRQVSQMVEDFQRLNTNGFGVDTITKGATDQLNALLQTAIDTGQKLPAALQPYIDQLATSGGLTDELKRQILGLADPAPWQDMQTAAEKYGISVDALGQGFKQARLDDAVKQLVSDWKLLTENGADTNAVIDGMKTSVQNVITEALKFGETIPDTMRPMIEKMVEAGELTDGQGEKLTDLTKLSFSHDLSEDFQALIDKISELIDHINGPGGLASAITNLPQPKINWPPLPGSTFTPEQSADYYASMGDLSKGTWVGNTWVPKEFLGDPSKNAPQMAGGGIVFPRPGGTLVNIGEAGYPETVLPGNWSALVAAATRMPNWDGAMAGVGISPVDTMRPATVAAASASGGGTVQLNIDGVRLAEALIPAWPRAKARYHLA